MHFDLYGLAGEAFSACREAPISIARDGVPLRGEIRNDRKSGMEDSRRDAKNFHSTSKSSEYKEAWKESAEDPQSRLYPDEEEKSSWTDFSWEIGRTILKEIAISAAISATCAVGAPIVAVGVSALAATRGAYMGYRTFRAYKAVHIVANTKSIQAAKYALPNAFKSSVPYTKLSNKLELELLDKLSKAGQVMDRGGLTKAGRALEKHGSRPGSVFPKAIGNAQNKNIQGQNALNNILTHPESYIKKDNLHRYGEVIEVRVPNKGGVRYSAEGRLIGFLEAEPL